MHEQIVSRLRQEAAGKQHRTDPNPTQPPPIPSTTPGHVPQHLGHAPPVAGARVCSRQRVEGDLVGR